MDTLLKTPTPFEGLRLRHNCKEGVVYLDGAPIQSGVNAVFLMEEATHGWLLFDEDKKLVESSIKRFVDVKPDRTECAPPRKPATSCLLIIEGAGLPKIGTYTASSWACRRAFMTQLLRPYIRVRKAGAYPVVSLGFDPDGRDGYGNFVPDFAITGWTPRSRFADLLGEEPDLAQLTAPTSPIDPPDDFAEMPTRGRMTVTSGRDEEAPPPIDDDDYGVIGEPIPF